MVWAFKKLFKLCKFSTQGKVRLSVMLFLFQKRQNVAKKWKHIVGFLSLKAFRRLNCPVKHDVTSPIFLLDVFFTTSMLPYIVECLDGDQDFHLDRIILEYIDNQPFDCTTIV